MNLDGLEGSLEFLKLALGLGASLTRHPAPWVSPGRGPSITLVLGAPLALEPAPWTSPGISFSTGAGFGKGRSDTFEFVTGLAWPAAESLGFGGSGYINVKIE